MHAQGNYGSWYASGPGKLVFSLINSCQRVSPWDMDRKVLLSYEMLHRTLSNVACSPDPSRSLLPDFDRSIRISILMRCRRVGNSWQYSDIGIQERTICLLLQKQRAIVDAEIPAHVCETWHSAFLTMFGDQESYWPRAALLPDVVQKADVGLEAQLSVQLTAEMPVASTLHRRDPNRSQSLTRTSTVAAKTLDPTLLGMYRFRLWSRTLTLPYFLSH